MTTYPLDRVIEELTTALQRLPPLKVAAFAACCAERLNPLYEEFFEATGWGNPAGVRESLNAAWLFLMNDGISRERIELLIPVVSGAMPHADDFGTAQGLFAQDACFCTELALAWCVQRGDRSYAIAEYALEPIRAAETLASTGYLDLGDSPDADSFEATLVETPNVSKEIAVQRSDLDLLGRDTELTAGIVSKLRRTAETNRWRAAMLLERRGP